MSSKIVLITGANRGLGLGLLKSFLLQPNVTVVATVRKPDTALEELPRAAGSILIQIKYDASVEADAAELIKTLNDEHKITHLDTVVANAGIAKIYPTVRDVRRSDIVEHMNVNVLGVISLYQAVYAPLQASKSGPTFAIIGSSAGALSRQPAIPNAAYGPSKAVLPWYAIRIHEEEPWLNAFVIDPGWVQTDMGNFGAKSFGLDSAPLTLDESVNGMMSLLTNGTRETFGGKFVQYTGKVLTW